MKVKYNRVSTLQQTGDRFTVDTEKYDLTLLDKVSGSLPFKERPKGKEVVKLIEEGKITELVVEEFSKLGRNTGDVMNYPAASYGVSENRANCFVLCRTV